MLSVPRLSDRSAVLEDPADYPPGVAFMRGHYLPISEAKISVLDNGFLHSDATYDVVHVWDGAFFRLDDHLDRFFAGFETLRMSIPYSRQQVTDILAACVGLSGLQNAYVEMICTRGRAAKGSRDPRDCENQFIAFAMPFVSIATPEQVHRGLHLAVTDLVRIPPSSVDPRVKNYHWLDLVQGLFAAYDKGAETAVLIDTKGNIAEGPGFNLFALINGTLITPDAGILLGITRQTIFDICNDLGLDCQSATLRPEQLYAAEEVFISSTAGGVMPVTKLNGVSVGAGTVGPTYSAIAEAYWKLHSEPSHRQPIRYDVFESPTPL